MPWVPVGGSSRRYRNTRSGRTISRRQYDNVRAKAAGFRNRYELERVREELAGSSWVGDIYDATGRGPTFRDYRAISNVKARRAEREAEGLDRYTEDQDDVLSDPDGDLAYLLDRTGRRQHSGYAVGGSP
jgi:hypothetical protein